MYFFTAYRMISFWNEENFSHVIGCTPKKLFDSRDGSNSLPHRPGGGLPYCSAFSPSHAFSPPIHLSVRSIRHVCPSCLSVMSVRHLSPLCLSVISIRPSHLSVCHVCPSCLSITSVHHVCPSCCPSHSSIISVLFVLFENLFFC